MSLKNDLMSRGYVEIGTRGKCKYYVKDGEKYAVAIAVRKGTEYPLIVENDVFEKLRYPSIWMNKRTNKMLVPSIQVCKRKYISIHNRVLPVQGRLEVDHINHNRFFCVESNLRYCTKDANAKNRASAVIIREVNGAYQFLLSEPAYGKEISDDLKNRGFNIIVYNGIRCAVKDITFKSKVDCYLAYRDTARAIYKGTELEDFVYDIENDFSETFNLLLDHYIFHDITEAEIYQMNLEYWRDKFNKESIARAV